MCGTYHINDSRSMAILEMLHALLLVPVGRKPHCALPRSRNLGPTKVKTYGGVDAKPGPAPSPRSRARAPRSGGAASRTVETPGPRAGWIGTGPRLCAQFDPRRCFSSCSSRCTCEAGRRRHSARTVSRYKPATRMVTGGRPFVHSSF